MWDCMSLELLLVLVCIEMALLLVGGAFIVFPKELHLVRLGGGESDSGSVAVSVRLRVCGVIFGAQGIVYCGKSGRYACRKQLTLYY